MEESRGEEKAEWAHLKEPAAWSSLFRTFLPVSSQRRPEQWGDQPWRMQGGPEELASSLMEPAFVVHKYCHRTWRTTEGGEAFSRENAIIDHLSWCSILGVDSGIMAFILSVGHPLEGNGAISPWTSQMAHSDDRSLPLHTPPPILSIHRLGTVHEAHGAKAQKIPWMYI